MTRTLPSIAVLLCAVSVGCGAASRTKTMHGAPGTSATAVSASPTIEAVQRCLRLAGFKVSKYSPVRYPSARDTEVEMVVTYLIAEASRHLSDVYTARRASPLAAVDVAVLETEADARKDVATVAEQKIEKALGVLDPYMARAAGNLGYVAWQGDPSAALALCGQG